MSTLVTISGWFGSAFVDTLVEKASSHALQQLGQRSDLRDEIGRLAFSLCKANVVLRLAEGKRTSAAHKNLAFIVAQLRDAAYDAEDLLADLDYEILRRKILQANEEASHDVLSSSLSFAANLVRSCGGEDDLAARACGVRERLDAVSADMREIINLLNLEDAVGRSPHEMLAPKRESSSFPTEPQMFGRDEEKETLIQQLLRSTADGSGSSAPDRNVSVLPIVGIGGVGKTTLAQFVYHDPRVLKDFKLKMWVCVSNQPFDVKRLTKEILESIDKNERYDLANLNCLQVTLKEKVTSKRYLLVLDDVWNEDGREWERLYVPLKYGLQGSTIMVTTRSRKVVEVMTGTLKPIFLKGLPEDVYWKFFKTHAFGSADSADHPEREEIAKLIAAKLKGSPLAAKTLGGLLNSSMMDARHWRTIMNSEIWELQQDENDIMPALQLSYQYLPSHLKRCFSFCSIFPQNYGWDLRELVDLWIAQGFIAPQANMLLEDVGKGYLLDLASRSFFQHHWADCIFQIHDLMHDLAQYVSKNECFRLQNDHQGIPSSIRHLSISTYNLKLHEVMDSGNFRKLRSLVCFGMFMPELNPTIEHWLDQLQYIRVLILRNCHITELPESIGNLKHLRFLQIYSENIKRLPESFCRLYNLQVLDIDECPFLERFPRGFTNLVNLRKLHAADKLVSSVTEIGKLNNLQYLNLFEVRKEHGHRIDELKNLNQLHGWLNVANLEHVESKDDACQANLGNKEYIDALALRWSSHRDTRTGSNDFSLDTEVLEGLKPHRDLKTLDIQCYRGDKLPSWLRTQALPYLHSLHLVDCPGITDLPSLPLSLKALVLDNLTLKSLPILWGESSIFDQGISAQGSSIKRSSLSKLDVSQCQNLTSFEEWLRPDRLPSIESIRIEYCTELVSLPAERFKDFISLKMLYIRNCPKLTSSKKLELTPSIKRLSLESCGELEWSLPSCLENLTSLAQLEICGCLHLECLPGQVMHHMRALSLLEITFCPELRSLGGLETLTSLHYLTIVGCPKLTDFEPLPSGGEVRRKDMSVLYSTVDKTVLLKQPFLQSLASSHQALHIVGSQESVLFDEGDDREWLQILTSLGHLVFQNCPNLQSLPAWLHGLTSLHNLSIYNCPAINSLPESGLPASPTSIIYDGCHPTLTEQLEQHKALRSPLLALKP